MLNLGVKQSLVVIKKVEFGVYLAVSLKEQKEQVLLPVKQVPADCKVGDSLEVFLYRDSKDRMIATVNEPKLKLGEVAVLRVAQVGRYGAFLDWGLEKDLLLPFKQQCKQVKEGEEVLVSLYVDRSNRLCATMNVYHNLCTESPYQKDDRVKGRIYEIIDNYGAFVAVDDKYSALIPKKELYGKVEPGGMVDARVIKVQEDGRLCLSIRERTCLQMQKDTDEILRLLDSYEGSLPFNDKASPEVIKYETGMSKNEFKRAVGHLLKQGLVEIGEKSIRLKKS